MVGALEVVLVLVLVLTLALTLAVALHGQGAPRYWQSQDTGCRHRRR